jgi:leucyl/phenylalanyl-tRNA--protein transferase
MKRPLLRWVDPGAPLPPAELALREPNGLLAAGRDLSADRLLEAYRSGIFPWYSAGQPVLWWSPDPRMVLELQCFKASRSLVKTVRRIRREARWRITLNQSFPEVIEACAEPRPGHGDGTWITPEIQAAYCELHRRGHAHSVEIRDHDDSLLGGLYGVSIGKMFYGESMFARAPDVSKIALYALVELLLAHGFRVIDCQQNTRHLASLGATEVPRVKFLSDVCELVALSPPDWTSVVIGLPNA